MERFYAEDTESNRSATMRWVRAMASGKGVSYKSGTRDYGVFGAGRRVCVSDDLRRLYDEFEEWLPLPEDKTRGWKWKVCPFRRCSVSVRWVRLCGCAACGVSFVLRSCKSLAVGSATCTSL